VDTAQALEASADGRAMLDDRDRKQQLIVDRALIPTIRRRCKFTDWEERFLDSIVDCRDPTSRQMERLNAIVSKGMKAPIPSLKGLIWHDVRLHLPSRLVWHMTEVSSRSKQSYVTRKTMAEKMSASDGEIARALRTITRQWRLFRWDLTERAYFRILRSRESSKQFKTRVQRTINVPVGICWILRDLVEEVAEDGRQYFRKAAPHSNEQFSKQLGCHPMSVSRCLDYVLRLGYFRRYNRKKNKPMYVHFDFFDNEIFDEKYSQDERTLDPTGINPCKPKQRQSHRYAKPAEVDRATAKVEVRAAELVLREDFARQREVEASELLDLRGGPLPAKKRVISHFGRSDRMIVENTVGS
jgi:hypothetical protein